MLDGKISFLIPKYSLIEVLEEVGEELEVKDKKGKWTKIQFGDKSVRSPGENRTYNNNYPLDFL